MREYSVYIRGIGQTKVNDDSHLSHIMSTFNPDNTFDYSYFFYSKYMVTLDRFLA